MSVIFGLRGNEFEWDETKAFSNEEKHQVSFETACEVFFDPLARYGDASVEHERREFVLGCTFEHDVLLAVYVERGYRTRIITARAATRAERKRYYESNRD
ncbi:MAG: BrnT family toxin [Acidobacteria bacterium]|nr:BrnT family toxin [Acidobacteriota bacterium]MBI3421433.1 BrnT family toxin [Acidobacteriota bacterium]